MSLSQRAATYLKTLERDLNWTSDVEETRNYLLRNNIFSTTEFLRYQALYSGYELTIKNDSGHSFRALLFSKKQIQENEKLEIEIAGDRLVQVCGDHKTAQFRFYLTQKGEICTLDSDDLPNILHSSFDKFLEEYALRNEIHSWSSNLGYFEVKNLDSLLDIMNNEFQIIQECSDNYSTWWQSDELIAVRGIWLDRPTSYFHVYGKSRTKCDHLIERLKTNEILS